MGPGVNTSLEGAGSEGGQSEGGPVCLEIWVNFAGPADPLQVPGDARAKVIFSILLFHINQSTIV